MPRDQRRTEQLAGRPSQRFPSGWYIWNVAALGDVLVAMPDRAEAPEAALRTAAIRGDLAAFEQLVARYERVVFGLALRLTGNTEDARDAVQGVFLRMHRKLHTVDPERSLGPWLYTVTLNVCRGIGRSRVRSRLVPMEEFVRLAAVDPAPGPERQFSGREAEHQLRAGLRELPEKERAALLLREVEDLTTAEVAKLLGSSETTVRSQISNARMKLRKFFAKHAGGAPMSCVEWQEQIALHAGGDLPDADEARLELHLAACPDCAELAAGLGADRARLRTRPPEVAEMDFERMRRELRGKIVRQRRLRRWAPMAAVAAALLVAVMMPSRTDRRIVRSVMPIEEKRPLVSTETEAPVSKPVRVVRKTDGKIRPSVLRAYSDVEMRLNTADPSVTIILLPVQTENPNE